MKKFAVILPLLAVLLLPSAVSAHETQVFKIGSASYQFVVGSLGEPVLTGDKTGVSLEVAKCYTPACTPTRGEDGDMDGPAGPAVEGLDESLKVEISAADMKKEFDLSPVWGSEGAYKAVFIPTVATTLSYRFFGTVDEQPVDVTFTCMSSGHSAEMKDDTSVVKVSDTVTRTLKSGAFGCPAPREEFGFPEPVVDARTVKNEAGSTKTFAIAAIVLSAVAVALAGNAMRRKKQG